MRSDNRNVEGTSDQTASSRSAQSCPPGRRGEVQTPAAGVDMVIANPFDEDLMEWIRIVEERDDSAPLNKLLIKLHDRVAAMEELQPDDVDMSDPQQDEIWKTVQVLLNKVIYTDSYLRL